MVSCLPSTKKKIKETGYKTGSVSRMCKYGEKPTILKETWLTLLNGWGGGKKERWFVHWLNKKRNWGKVQHGAPDDGQMIILIHDSLMKCVGFFFFIIKALNQPSKFSVLQTVMVDWNDYKHHKRPPCVISWQFYFCPVSIFCSVLQHQLCEFVSCCLVLFGLLDGVRNFLSNIQMKGFCTGLFL